MVSQIEDFFLLNSIMELVSVSTHQLIFHVFANQFNNSIYGLRTSNEGINQRNLKVWADVADKIYASAVPKSLGLGFDFRPCSEDDFLTGCPQSVVVHQDCFSFAIFPKDRDSSFSSVCYLKLF